ncbi:MAG TPA: Asd/ArgC dimerization domain-containing protein [Acidobacteriaceae bacterium]|jgi:aspartate-semialdehyde dehydrogenase|nr:Asd/ArgC dimerization domain-containing protein [Acidobacteriaceae bacterium]
MTDHKKIAIVGAGSLRGKELNEALADSPFADSDFVLMDDEAELGSLEAVADEVTFIQRIDADAFAHVDFVFFAGDQQLTLKHWQKASRAGASIVDLSGALEGQPGVLVRAPWVTEQWASEQRAPEGLPPAPTPGTPGLETPAIVPAHAVSVALALLLARAAQDAPLRAAAATVLEPASEYGRAAMDELHQQTVKLLSFQELPRQIYDTQVAFNTTPAFGEAAKFSLAASESRIRRHYDLLTAGRLPEPDIQLLHVPVFHGYGLSLAFELTQPSSLDQMEASLAGEHVEVNTADADPPTNLTVAGQPNILVRVRPHNTGDLETTRFRLWAGFDNLRFATLNALACALELKRLRPSGEVQ